MTRAVILWLAMATSVNAATLEERTFPASVVRVIDGDSVVVQIENWPLPFNPVELRLEGIDTPESRKQDAKCEKEQKLGLIAKFWLRERLPPGSPVTVIWTGEREKYGRLLSEVISKGENINRSLVRLGFAVEYHGGTKLSWCTP